MEIIHHDCNRLNKNEKNAVAIGNFDGCHAGHKKIVEKLLQTASNEGLRSLVYTFEQHPVNFFKGSGTLKLIADNDEKIRLFEKMGVDTLFFEDFAAVYSMSPEDFVMMLLNKLNMKSVIVGADNRFGRNSEGDADFLRKMGKKHGFSVHVADIVRINGKACSSTEIRKLIKEAEMKEASCLLGRLFSVGGTIVHGKHLGEKLGFPTANIIPDKDKLLPPFGVYSCNITFDGKKYKAVANVGTSPTVNDSTVRIETHIPGFCGNLYGKYAEVEFIYKMRDICDFQNIDQLVCALKNDIKTRLSEKE